MKKILVLLLAVALLFESVGVLAEGEEAITLELNTANLPVYAADDPFLNDLGAQSDSALPVLVIPIKRSYQLQVAVQPKTVKNKRFTLAADNEEILQAKGSNVLGLKPGEAVLTIASQEDPSATLQYRVVVIQPVTRLSVTMPEKSVAVGSTMTLTPEYVPEDASLKKVTWSSADERFATVDENGTVTGIKKGNVRIVATAVDGSNLRANINVKVTQSAEEVTLDKQDLTVDVGRTGMLKATVLPNDTDNKKVVWSSSDESVATVNASGRVTGVALGECEIICTSEGDGEVQAKAAIHVQQPVKSITFDPAPIVYNNETAQLTWKIEPEDASNKVLALTSSNEKIVKVSEDGTITGIGAGEAYVNAVTTDGSNRKAKIKVKVFQHVTGVHMKRKVAYIDPKQTSTTGAILEPSKVANSNMTWESADESIATVEPEPKDSSRVRITGHKKGTTTVTGTTEDGGFTASIKVKIGDWEKSLSWKKASVDGKGRFLLQVRNDSDLTITSITVEAECKDWDGKPAKGINTKDGSNVIRCTYKKTLKPGAVTKEDGWKAENYDRELGFKSMVVRIVEFQINNDWVKVIRKNNRPKKKYSK